MKMLRNLSFALAICLSATWLGAQSNAAVVGAQPDAISVQPAIELQPGGNPTAVKAIVTDGETGEVIANSTLTFITIDVPGEGFTSVQGVNASGEMVGIYSENDVSLSHGFSRSGGRFSRIDYPGAGATRAFGINDSGLIVGEADFQNDTVEHGFEYDGTTFTAVQDPKNSATICLGINNAGWVVGTDGTLFATKGFELRNGRFGTMNFPGLYVYGYAAGINNLGQVVGFTVDGLYQDAYRYGKGKFQKIDFPGATETEVWGINDSGVIVGWYNPMSAHDYGFALRKGRYISFSYPGAANTAAYGINAYGQIVGTYSLDYETYHGFITSPLTPADFPPDE